MEKQETDILDPFIFSIFDEDRKKTIIPPQNISSLLENLKEKMYINKDEKGEN